MSKIRDMTVISLVFLGWAAMHFVMTKLYVTQLNSIENMWQRRSLTFNRSSGTVKSETTLNLCFQCVQLGYIQGGSVKWVATVPCVSGTW